jgi:hypothetical protein
MLRSKVSGKQSCYLIWRRVFFIYNVPKYALDQYFKKITKNDMWLCFQRDPVIYKTDPGLVILTKQKNGNVSFNQYNNLNKETKVENKMKA